MTEYKDENEQALWYGRMATRFHYSVNELTPLEQISYPHGVSYATRLFVRPFLAVLMSGSPLRYDPFLEEKKRIVAHLRFLFLLKKGQECEFTIQEQIHQGVDREGKTITVMDYKITRP